MKPYSQDLRERILCALATDETTQREVAARFGGSLSFVEKLWQCWRAHGSGVAPPHAGGKPRSLPDHAETLRREGARQLDATLEAWRERVASAQGLWGSPATMCRA